MEHTNTHDSTPWYAVRLFGLRWKRVRAYFEERGATCFVPMRYVEREDGGKIRRELRPVVSNIIFVKASMGEKDMRQWVEESPERLSVVRGSRDDKAYYEISAREMEEFQQMCNPEIELRQYLSEEEAQLKTGTQVLVKYGPLKGLTGRLVRSNKKYFLLKEIPGLAVMLKVGRWCCVPLSS